MYLLVVTSFPQMTDSQSIELTVQLNQKDIYRANVSIVWGRHKLHEWAGIAVCAAILGGYCFGLLFSQTKGIPGLWSGAAFGIIFLPVFLYGAVHASSHSAAKSLFRNTPALRGPTVWSFSENGITAVGPTGRAELQWNSYIQVRETREQFLLYPQKQFANVIPKRFFQSEREIERFREILRRLVPIASLQPNT
jgi:hypothetical protein